MYFWRYADYDVNAVRSVYIMGEDDKIIEYIKAYVKREGTAPSVRKFCRDQNTTAPAFYRRHGSMVKLLERAGLPIDERTKARLLISKKATRIRVRKAERKRSRVQTRAPSVEGADGEPAQTSTFEKIEWAREEGETAQDRVKEHVQQFIEELKTLVLGTTDQVSVEVNTAILEALNEVVPVVLFYKYDIMADIPDLLAAKDVLRQARKEREKLRKEQIQLDGERLEIQHARELLKRDSDKKSLLEHVEKLEWRMKVDIKRFTETYDGFKQFRTLFRELMPVIRRFPPCQKAFVQNMMENHNDVLKWLTSGGMRLSFEAEGAYKPYCQT